MAPFTRVKLNSIELTNKFLIKRKNFSPTSGLNFINALHTTFTCAYPTSVKKTVKFSIFFTLSGSKSVKAAHKTLVKLTSDDKRTFR